MTTLERLERECAKKLHGWTVEELRRCVVTLASKLDRKRTPKKRWGYLSDLGKTLDKPKRGRPTKVPISDDLLLGLRASYAHFGFESLKECLDALVKSRRRKEGRRTTGSEVDRDIRRLQQRASEVAKKRIRKIGDNSA
jgi:hypothetical protein